MKTAQQSLLREGEVAQRLAISVKTLRNWRWRGFGPSFCKLGSSVRYAATDIEEWVARRTAKSTAETPS
jgi:predicted DNA-binding transcriptional regulator AlpA